MADDPISGRIPKSTHDAVLAEAQRVAADIRRRAERDAQAIRREAAEWAATTRREAEQYRDRLSAEAEAEQGAGPPADTGRPTPAPRPASTVPPPEPGPPPTPPPPTPPEPGPQSTEPEQTTVDPETSAFVDNFLAEHRRRRRWRIVAVALVAALVVAAGAVLVANNLPASETGPEVPRALVAVPELTDVPPDVRGRPLAEVIDELEDSGLDFTFARVFDDDIPAGAVVSMAGAYDVPVPRGTTVPLLVSKGPARRTVPHFEQGADAGTVVAALVEAGLRPQRRDVFHDDLPAGAVLEVSPEPGTTLPRGAAVTVTVSQGPDVVTVPDVVGRTFEEALSQLRAAGLTAGEIHGHGHGAITDQAPDAGTAVRRGASVNLRRGP